MNPVLPPEGPPGNCKAIPPRNSQTGKQGVELIIGLRRLVYIHGILDQGAVAGIELFKLDLESDGNVVYLDNQQNHQGNGAYND